MNQIAPLLPNRPGVKDGLGLAVAAVLGAGCCLALPLVAVLTAGTAIYVFGGLLAAATAVAVALLVVAYVRRRRAAALERPPRARVESFFRRLP